MKKNRLWRLVGGISLVLALMLGGFAPIKAEGSPTIELSNSAGTWNLPTGRGLILTGRVFPDNYRSVSRIEIRQGSSILANCTNQNVCEYSLPAVAGGTTMFQAVAYDVDGRIFSSSVMNLVGSDPDRSAPSVTLTGSRSEVGTGAGTGFVVEARATDISGLSSIRINRVDTGTGDSKSCVNELYNCTLSISPVFDAADVGRVFIYEASATDIYGNVGVSSRVSVRVTGNNNPNNRIPGIYLDRGTVPEQVNADRNVSIRAEAWDNEALNRVTITATPRGSNVAPYTNTCYTSNPNLTCFLNIANFFGFEGRTFDVVATTVDAVGQSVTSQTYTILVSGNVVNPPAPVDRRPTVVLDPSTIPSEVQVGQTVNIRADAWDNESLNRVTIYALPRVYGYGYNPYGYTGGNNLTKTCYSSGTYLTCYLTINGFYGYEGQTFDVWAQVYDSRGAMTASRVYNMRVAGSTVPNQKPGIYLNPNTIPTEVKTDSSVSIKAEAWDNEALEKLTIYAVDSRNVNLIYNPNDSKRNYQKICYSSARNLTCSLDINTFVGNEGVTFNVWAVAMDATGGSTKSSVYTMRVAPRQRVVPTVSTNVFGSTNLPEDRAVTIYGKASAPSGIWGVEVRALPSWTNEAITRRCILEKFSTAGSCDLTIGPFRGHAGHTVKVWTIAWDKETGMGGSSEAKNIAVTTAEQPNVAPKVSITPSSQSVNSSQKVTWRVNASDTNGIDKIDLYVNAQIVKTCSGTDTCEYTGGPFRNYAGTSVSYAAKVWDKTGKSTWTGYKYVTVSREMARRPARVRVATLN